MHGRVRRGGNEYSSSISLQRETKCSDNNSGSKTSSGCRVRILESEIDFERKLFIFIILMAVVAVIKPKAATHLCQKIIILNLSSVPLAESKFHPTPRFVALSLLFMYTLSFLSHSHYFFSHFFSPSYYISLHNFFFNLLTLHHYSFIFTFISNSLIT